MKAASILAVMAIGQLVASLGFGQVTGDSSPAALHSPAMAQQRSIGKRVYGQFHHPEDSGTNHLWQILSAADFAPVDSTTSFASQWNPLSHRLLVNVTGGNPRLVATVHLPTGVLLTDLSFSYCDINVSGQHLTFNLYDCDQTGNCIDPPLYTFDSGTDIGCTAYYTVVGAVSQTIDNYNSMLIVEVVFGATDTTNELGGINFGYIPQVGPPPSTPTFADVPADSPFYPFVEALATAGATAGCGGGNFCPDDPITRAQVAAFIAKVFGLGWRQ